jgi:energy-coupling factor transporter ATP-binding protein EcfA2
MIPFPAACRYFKRVPAFESIEIAAFRGLPHLELSNCGKVNLLVGRNNSGKTSVLEALALLTRPDDLEWWIDTFWSREVKSARTPEREVIKHMFPHLGVSSPDDLFEGRIELKSRTNNGRSLILTAKIEEKKMATRDLLYYKLPLADGSKNPLLFVGDEEHTTLAADLDVWVIPFTDSPDGARLEGVPLRILHQFSERGALPFGKSNRMVQMPSAYVTTVAHRTENLTDKLSYALTEDRRASILSLLQAIQPTITNVEILTRPNQGAQVWLKDEKTGWMPISTAGDGLRRALHFAAAAATAKGGVLLIDEIESALHRDTLRKIFGHLLSESKALDVQIFATTHSLEALDAILAESTEESPLVVYNLSPAGAHRTPLNRLRTIREEHGLDIR